jgi:hypothetical protein
MLGISVHGLLGVDADLQRSAFAARVVQERNGSEYHSVRVLHRHGDCDRYDDARSARSRT